MADEIRHLTEGVTGTTYPIRGTSRGRSLQFGALMACRYSLKNKKATRVPRFRPDNADNMSLSDFFLTALVRKCAGRFACRLARCLALAAACFFFLLFEAALHNCFDVLHTDLLIRVLQIKAATNYIIRQRLFATLLHARFAQTHTLGFGSFHTRFRAFAEVRKDDGKHHADQQAHEHIGEQQGYAAEYALDEREHKVA